MLICCPSTLKNPLEITAAENSLRIHSMPSNRNIRHGFRSVESNESICKWGRINQNCGILWHDLGDFYCHRNSGRREGRCAFNLLGIPDVDLSHHGVASRVSSNSSYPCETVGMRKGVYLAKPNLKLVAPDSESRTVRKIRPPNRIANDSFRDSTTRTLKSTPCFDSPFRSAILEIRELQF